MSSESRLSISPDERSAILALTLVADIGSVKHRQLLERFGTAMRALDDGVAPGIAREARGTASELMALGASRGMMLTTIVDENYPASLRQLYDPPAVLWSRGEWSTLRGPVVAVVGTRRATSYGLRATREIVGALARAGACIVSGMALGIDAEAHRAALDAGGDTVAVLGTGADIAYPRAHAPLLREIVDHGLVLSELSPGARSDAGSFPRRNRIIAGLAALTIVIEAPMRSGALLTSGHALELGRDVAAVPGQIDSPQSAGTNVLLQDGAHVITSPEDALRLVGLEHRAKRPPELSDPGERQVWDALAQPVASLDELCARCSLPVAQCMAVVTALEVRGLIECALTGHVQRR